MKLHASCPSAASSPGALFATQTGGCSTADWLNRAGWVSSPASHTSPANMSLPTTYILHTSMAWSSGRAIVFLTAGCTLHIDGAFQVQLSWALISWNVSWPTTYTPARTCSPAQVSLGARLALPLTAVYSAHRCSLADAAQTHTGSADYDQLCKLHCHARTEDDAPLTGTKAAAVCFQDIGRLQAPGWRSPKACSLTMGQGSEVGTGSQICPRRYVPEGSSHGGTILLQERLELPAPWHPHGCLECCLLCEGVQAF